MDSAFRRVRDSTLPQIAVQRRISVYTVRNHLKAIYSKTNIRSRAMLVQAITTGPPIPPLATHVWPNHPGGTGRMTQMGHVTSGAGTRYFRPGGLAHTDIPQPVARKPESLLGSSEGAPKTRRIDKINNILLRLIPFACFALTAAQQEE